MRPDVCRAERTMLRRLDPDRVGHSRALESGRREMDAATVDSLAVHENLAVNGSHGADIMRVHEIDVANVRVEDVSVADKRIALVDSLEEFVAAVEPREEWLAETQREPANAETKASAEETDKGRPIDRRTKDGARAPAPPAREIVPAAIVIGSKTPRRIVNPSPTPGADVVPVTVAVRSPVRANIVGIPDMAIFRLILPGTVVVEIAVARHIARNVVSGNGIVLLQVAVGGPAVKTVRTGSLVNAGFNVVRAGKFRALACMDRIGFATGGHFAFAAKHRHARGVAIFIHVDAKCS